MMGIKNKNAHWKKNYISIMRSLITQVQSLGYQAVLLNHEGVGDRDICNTLNQLFDNKLDIIEELDPLKVKGIIGDSKAIVCSRFHGCVSALSQGVVNLGTSWSHKYEQLYKEYGVSALLIDPTVNDATQIELINAILADDEPYSKVISDNAVKYKEITEKMWQSVVRVVDC